MCNRTETIVWVSKYKRTIGLLATVLFLNACTGKLPDNSSFYPLDNQFGSTTTPAPVVTPALECNNPVSPEKAHEGVLRYTIFNSNGEATNICGKKKGNINNGFTVEWGVKLGYGLPQIPDGYD